MKGKLFLFIFLFKIAFLVKAQDVYQNIRGSVFNEAGFPLAGATIFLNDTSLVLANTDSSGIYRLRDVKVGRHVLTVKRPGFEDVVIQGLLVDASKEAVLEIRLSEKIQTIGEVTVTSSFQQPGEIKFTVEETKRFAATFYDPARLITSHAGIVSDNDQANNIVIRGNSPNGLLWRLEGIDMLNPNHLDNAGTFSDRAALNGGGVNILSAQLLDHSKLILGPYDAEYGNFISGVFDIKLRKGNNENHEFTGQASFLGLDFAAEGPFSKSKKSSYLVNYRYSTIGILSAFGVDFDGEKISYQDLSFNLYFPSKKLGNFTLFGLGGPSSTTFTSKRDSSVWETFKERTDVEFKSFMTGIGMTHKIAVNSKLDVQSSAGISVKNIDRTGDYLSKNFELQAIQKDDYSQRKISIHSSANYFMNHRNTFSTGVNVSQLFYEVYTLDRVSGELKTTVQGDGNYQLLQPYISWKTIMSKKLTFTSGIHYAFLSINKSQSWEPRFMLNYNFRQKNLLTFSFNRISALQSLSVYNAVLTGMNGSAIRPNEHLGFTKADHYSIAYSKSILRFFKIKIDLYYQQIFDVPVSNDGTFSMLNALEEVPTDSLFNNGEGKNYGVEFTVRKEISGGYYFILNSTIYRAKSKFNDAFISTRYDGKYACNFSGGREFSLSRNRSLEINIRSVLRGGYRERPISIILSEQFSQTIYQEDGLYANKLKDYFRVDVRISLKKQRERYTRTIALDIQNASNYQNIAYHYYDPSIRKISIKYQLGIIPVLSYRVEWGR